MLFMALFSMFAVACLSMLPMTRFTMFPMLGMPFSMMRFAMMPLAVMSLAVMSRAMPVIDIGNNSKENGQYHEACCDKIDRFSHLIPPRQRIGCMLA